jgi:calcineurin-like phosphoesterase family protein
MSVWFSADFHLGHLKVLEYSHRPFSSIDEMDEAIISNTNKVVKPGDTLFILGDFAFYRDQSRTRNAIRRLIGNKVLIKGNHDDYLKPETLAMFGSVHDYLEIRVPDSSVERGGKRLITLLHYPMKVWRSSHHGSFHLFGHSHSSMPYDPHSLSFDVGVDCWDYTPISFEKVKEEMSKKTFKPVDRHGRDER